MDKSNHIFAVPESENKVDMNDVASQKLAGSGFNGHDEEKQGHPQIPDLKRKLKNDTTGTGLFIGSGAAIAKSGPAGALIAYVFVGSIIYSVMVFLGEMATYIPISGAFTSYATRFIDPSLATGLIIQFWSPNLSIAIFISVFWVLITAVNFLPVRFYGEFEFWFNSIKVLTVIGFIVFAICIDAGAGQNGYLEFDTWRNPGAFANYLIEDGPLAKFSGFWAVLIQAGFSYQGTELVGIAAGETENPRKNVPAAIRKTFYRILFFFVFSIFFIGLLVPYDNLGLLSNVSDATASPFVIAANLAGVKVLPGLINAILLFVVLSAANSSLYSGSRILNLSNNGSTVFNWFLNITAIAGFTTWACINGCHIAFMRALSARKISRESLPYKALWQPFFAYYSLFFNILIIGSQGFTAFIPWNVSEFFVAHISILLFVLLYLGHKVITRTSFVKATQADIDMGCIIHDKTNWSIEVPSTAWGKVWTWVC